MRICPGQIGSGLSGFYCPTVFIRVISGDCVQFLWTKGKVAEIGVNSFSI